MRLHIFSSASVLVGRAGGGQKSGRGGSRRGRRGREGRSGRVPQGEALVRWVLGLNGGLK